MKFIELSEGVYLFGEGGINRFEPMDKRDGIRTAYETILYNNTSKISCVKETVQEILYKLGE